MPRDPGQELLDTLRQLFTTLNEARERQSHETYNYLCELLCGHIGMALSFYSMAEKTAPHARRRRRRGSSEASAEAWLRRQLEGLGKGGA